MTDVERGGPQVIPRPVDWVPGPPAPWAALPAPDRVVDVARLRAAFTDRVGAPSFVEAMGTANGSAVLAPFYEHEGELHVVLTRRAWTLRAHTGEVSFPGGRIDEGETALQAACREAHEEVGLDPTSVEILGELDHLMTVTSSSFIVPHVAVVHGGRPDLVPSPGEVDAVLHVPVGELLRDDVYREERWVFPAGVPWARASSPEGAPAERSIFFFELVGDTLWGATAAMLRQLLGLALGLDTGIQHA